MIKLVLTVILSITLFGVGAQSPYSEVKLEEKTDYLLAEKKVLQASTFLFTTRFDKEDLDRLYAIEFIMKWMTGTPDFSFDINDTFSKAFANDADLLGLYMAAVVKFTLENKGKALNNMLVGFNATKMLIEYSNKTSNNLKQSGELKKMSAALKKGELEKYLGI